MKVGEKVQRKRREQGNQGTREVRRKGKIDKK